MLIPHEYLFAKTTQKLIQIAQFLYWDKGKCLSFDRTQANKVYTDQTAPIGAV